MNLIIALEGSGSFARTHSIIAELAKHKWNGEEKETLFNIAVENSQVFYILEDEAEDLHHSEYRKDHLPDAGCTG